FEDLAVVAPRPTLFVLTAADSIRSSPWTLVLLVASTLVLDGVVHYALHRWAPRAWSRLWGWALAVLLIGCIALVYLAVHVPFAQVVQNASVYRSR
ncbi:MAG: hypothetical protein K9N51_04795, partial [Candidatus Pacebacteria bacterium]|nr:hypothetical protein [Candidatus Paceibacterota bacterium]